MVPGTMMTAKDSLCRSTFLLLVALAGGIPSLSHSAYAFVPSIPMRSSSFPAIPKSLTATTTTRLKAEATTADRPKLVQGIRDIVNDYDLFLLDMWGVMHDGSRPYDGVLDVVSKLVKDYNKRLVILSNSSKRQDHSIKMLRKLGFDPQDFEKIITSGEVAYQMLQGKGEWLRFCQPWEPLSVALVGCNPIADQASPPSPSLSASSLSSKSAFCFGSGDDDEAYLNSCEWNLAESVESADLLVARGTFTLQSKTVQISKNTDPDLYEIGLKETLKQAAQKRIPMIVCNPDKVRPDVGRPPMPGMIGDLYEAALMDAENGGCTTKEEAEALVKRVGKPDRDVYDIALEQGQQAQPSTMKLPPRACMIGDALETDVTGGSAYGIDTIWVLCDGIHSPDVEDYSSLEEGAMTVLETFNQQEGTYAKGRKLAPTVLLPSFVW
jgi:ribonucleotide monophosphatase NagD (HAD superfamily)